jgi:hypothetical protein
MASKMARPKFLKKASNLSNVEERYEFYGEVAKDPDVFSSEECLG